MALFAVIALKDATPAVDQAVAALPAQSTYKIEAGKWIVSSSAPTAKQLAIELGLRESVSHLVLSFRGYSGRAQPDLWEWLSTQAES